MNRRAPQFHQQQQTLFNRNTLLISLVFMITLLLPDFSFAAFINGGDQLWSFHDQLAGKQNPIASVIDSQGNTIIAGSRILPGSNFEECYTIKVSPAGTLIWRGVHNKAGFNVRAIAVVVDASDNVYVTGAIDGANADIFTLRYDRDQSGLNAIAAWQTPFDGGGTDRVTSLVVDGEYVFVGGSSRYAGNECYLVLKYNKADGILLLQIPNASSSTFGRANSIAANASGIAVTGFWGDSDVFFKTIKYNSAGQFVWEKQYSVASPPQGFKYNDAGKFVRLDSKGHVVVTGYVSNGVNADIYTVKYCNSNASPCDGKNPGDILWEQTYAGPDDAKPDGLYIEQQISGADDVYITGHAFIEGRYHIYTARYKSAFSPQQEIWHSIFNSGSDNHDNPAALIVSANEDSLYVAGYSENAGGSDFRTVKYRKSTGTELWKQVFNSAVDGDDRAVGIGLDSAGQVYVAGYADETTELITSSATTTNGTNPKSVIQDGNRDWTSVNWTGYYVKMTGLNNKDEYRKIISNTATTLTLNNPLPNDILAGDSYSIYDQDDYDYYVVKYEKGLLEAPSNLVASSNSSSALNLSWQDNNAVTPYFRVERCTNGYANLTATPCNFDNPAEINIAADGINTTSFLDSGLDQDKYYYYRVKAYIGPDFEHATLVTYPSNIDHAVTQNIGTSSSSKTYTYTGVANSDDYALAIAVSPVDGKPVVTGKSFFTPGGLDYYTIRLDRDLNKLWSQRYNGPEGQSDVAVCLAVDKNDQITVSGYAWLFNSKVLPSGKDMNSVYTIKYKTNAAPEPETDVDLINEWSHQYNGLGGGDDRAVAIAANVDAFDNIAVVGMGLHTSTDYQKHDIYLLHYPPNGPGTAALPNPGYWAATPIHERDDNQPTAVVFDPWGNVIVTGFTGSLSNPADPASAIIYDIYTAKFCGTSTSGCPVGKNPGDLIWKQTYDGLHGDDEANDVTVDGDGNIYVTGFTTNAQQNWDYVTLKYDRDGNLQSGWPKVYDGPAHGDDEAISIKYDSVEKSIVIAGNRLTDPGNNDIHTIRYRASDGLLLWEKTLLREHNNEDMVEMAMDVSGSVLITATTTNGSSTDIITFKLDWQGNISGNATVFSTANRENKPYSIVTNKMGEGFIAGITQNAFSNADYLVLKIDADPIQNAYPLTATAGYVSITLDWADNSLGEDGYQVARRNGACPSDTFTWAANEIITTGPTHLGANTITYSNSGLLSNTTYCYGVRAFKGASYSRWVNTSVTTTTPPAPTPVSAAAIDTSTVKVSWTATTSGHTGFEIERCMDGSGNSPCTDFSHLYLAAAVDINYLDTTVCPGNIYRYRVKAQGAGWESAFSTTVGAILPTVDNIAVDSGFETPNPMAAGQNVGWTIIGGTVVSDISFDTTEKRAGAQSLNVNAVSTATISGIKQYVFYAPGGKYQISAWFKTAAAAGKATCDLYDAGAGSFSNSGTTTNWEQRSLSITASTTSFPGGSRIRCYASTGSQANIDDLQATPIYDLTATRSSEMQINLAWVPSSYDATGYKIERCAGVGCESNPANFSQIATVTAKTISYIDGALTPTTSYSYRIRPYKTFGQSCSGSPGWNGTGWDGSYSNIASAVATNNPPVLTISSPDTTTVNLSWSDTTTNETEFQIVRGSGSDCNAMSPLITLPQSSGAGLPVSYSDATVCNNTPYSYCVKAVSQGLSMTGLSQPGGGKWISRTRLDFGSPISTFKPNFLTRITINQLTGMDATFKDIRFHDASSGVELPYWIQGISGSTATVWFKTGNNDNIYLYFNNSSAISSSTTSSKNTVLGSGLAGYWPFEEPLNSNTTTTPDVSGNAKNGAFNYPSGFGIVSGGIYGNALSLPGNTYRNVSIADTTASSLDITGSMTVELWYNYQGANGANARLFSKNTTPNESYMLVFDATGTTLSFQINSGSNQYVASPSSPVLSVGWHHIVGRYDNSKNTNNLSIFVDGVEYSSSVTPITISTNNGYLGIGSDGTGYYAAKGMVDETRLYNRAITNAEIGSRYAATLPVVSVPLQSDVITDINGLQPRLPVLWDGPFGLATITTPAKAVAPTLAPSGVTRYSEGQIDLAWTFTTTDQAGFKIDRCGDATCGNVLSTFTAPAAARNYSDTGLTYNTTYWYRVRAYKPENPSCNGGAGYWETANSAIQSQNTNLSAPTGMIGSTAITTDCADFRFMDSDNTSKLFYYVANKDDLNSQCNKVSTKLIVKIPTISAGGKQIKLYYGNPLAPSASTGDIFDFFEDFDYSSINDIYSQNKWDSAKSDLTGFSLVNSSLHGTNTTGRLTSKAPYTFGAGYQVQSKVKSISRPQLGFIPIGLRNSWGDDAGLLLHGSPAAIYYSIDPNWAQIAASLNSPSLGNTMQYSMVLKSATIVNPVIYNWEGSNNSILWDAGDLTQTVNTRPIVIGRRYEDTGGTNQTYNADWEWIRVRKYANPAPSSTLGSLDTSGAPYSVTGETGSWLFRRPITVNYATGATLSNYQLNVVVDTIALAIDQNTLTWTDKTANESSFTLERCDGADCTTSSFPRTSKTFTISSASGVGTQVSYTDKETSINSNYCYRVKAVNTAWALATPTAGETGYSNTSCMTTVNPVAPSNLQASAQTSTISITWNDNTANETGFTLERCQDNTNGETACSFLPGNNYSIDVPPNNTATGSFTDSSTTGLPCSGTFRYRISAYKFNPDWVRGPSTVAGPVTLTSTPATPTITATRTSEQQITVGWSDPYSGESGYEIFRCAGQGCTPTSLLTTSAANTITYIDSNNIVPGTTYGYLMKVKIPTACGDVRSLPSTTVYAAASLTAPSLFTTTSANTTQANLGWTDTTAAESGFFIMRCSGPPPCSTSYDNITTAAAGSGARTYNDQSVCADTTYTYMVSSMEHPSMPLSNPAGAPVWKFKSPLKLSNFKADFITQITLAYDPDMKANFEDIRFYDRDARVELPHWIQSSTASSLAVVWFKTGATAGIDLYYGNPNAISSSNKDMVFGTGTAGTGPVGYWPFEESTQFPTTTADVSGAGNNLTMTGFTSPNGVITGGGKYGNALSLDGNGDYAFLTSPVGLPSGNPATASAEAWVYPTGTPWDYNGIVSWGNRTTAAGFAMSLNIAAKPQFAGWGNDYNSPGAALVLNTWNHLAVVINGSSAITYYVNGSPLTGNLSGSLPLNLASTNLAIGSLQLSAGSRNFQGKIDEVRIYNRALTAPDIAARYSASPPTATVGPKTSTALPVRMPLAFSAFQPNSLAKVMVARNPSSSASNNPRPDFRDLRFLDRDANIEIPYWVRKINRDGSNNPISAEVWFMTGATAAIDLFYGNPSSNFASLDTMGWWPFEEEVNTTSGASADLSGWGMNGTLNVFNLPNGVVSGGKFRNGLNLDGAASYVSVPATGAADPLRLDGSMTVELWYKHDTASMLNGMLLKKSNAAGTIHYSFYLNGAVGDTYRNLIFRVVDGTTTNIASTQVAGVTDDKLLTDTGSHDNWYHVVGRYDALTGKIDAFINGVNTAHGDGIPGINAWNADGELRIGRTSGTGSNYIKGTLDDVRIYNRALTDPEIQARATEGASLQVATISTPPVGYWPFEESPQTSGYTADRSATNPPSRGVISGVFPVTYGIQAGGKFGNGLKLDGTSNFISIPVNAGAPLDMTGSMSIDLWYYYDSTKTVSGRSLLTRNYDAANTYFKYNLFLQTGGTVEFAVYDTNHLVLSSVSAGTSPALINNAWNHIAGVYNASLGTISVYVNGVGSTPATITANAPGFTSLGSSSQPLKIGANRNITYFTPGIIDEVGIYDRPLTSQEISAHSAASAAKEMKTIGTTTTTTVVTANPANLLINPDMESSSSWSTLGVTGVFTTSVPYSGSYSLVINSTTTIVRGNSQSVAVVPGAQYQLSGYLKTNMTAGQAQCDVQGTGIDSPGIVSSGLSEWTYKTETVTIPLGTTSVSIRCFADGSPFGQAWIDMVQFVPLAPITLSATRVSESSIDLSWNDIFTEETGYNIYRCIGPGCSFSATPYLQVTSADRPFRDSGLQPDQSYSYRMSAYKTATCPWESTASNTVTLTTSQAQTIDLSVAQKTSTSLQLNWSDKTSTESGYNIYRCMGIGCEPCSNPVDCSTTTATYSIQAGNISRSLDQWRVAYFSFFYDLLEKNNNDATGITNLSNQITGISNVSGLAVGSAVSGLNIPTGTTVTEIFSDPASWTKYNNSVPGKSDSTGINGQIPLANTAGRGDFFGVGGQAVIKDDSGIYKMWYSALDVNSSSSWRIYHAISSDGLTWSKVDNTTLAPNDKTGVNGRIPLGTDTKTNNVNTNIGDGVHVFASQSVIKDGVTYKLWYSGHDGQFWRIYYATSYDGLSWTKVDNTILAPADTGVTPTNGNGRLPLGTSGTGDSNGVFAPTVIKDGGTYKMWYAGSNGTYWRIYSATSSDGLNWTKLDNSVLAPTDAGSTPTNGNGRVPLGNAGKGDSNHTRYPSVIKDGSVYRMWYAGSNGTNWRIFSATSTDGLNWTKLDNTAPSASDTTGSNGRIPLGLATKGDNAGTNAPAIIKEGSNYRMWYIGHDASGVMRSYHANSLTTATLSKNPTAAAPGTFIFGPANGLYGSTDPALDPYQITGLANTSGLVAGMAVTGNNIPASTTIVSINGTTAITLSNNPTAAASGYYFFGLTLTPSNGSNYTPAFDAAGGLFLSDSSRSWYTPAISILDNDNHTIEFDIKFAGGNNNYKNIFVYNPAGGANLVISTLGWGNISQPIKLNWSYNGAGVIDLSADAYGIPFATNRWYRFRGVKNGSVLTVYVNDMQSATAAVPLIDHVAGSRSAPIQIHTGNSYPTNVTIKNLGIFSGYTGPLPSSQQSFTDVQLCPGNLYNYRVMPFNYLVSWTGATSNRAGNTTAGMNPPTGLTAKVKTDTQIDLSWTPAAENDQNAFMLKECTGGPSCVSGTSGVNIGNYSATSRTNLVGETSYCYQVAGWKASAYCNSGSGITSSFKPDAPVCVTSISKAPTTLSATAIGPYMIRLDWWDESGDETGFEIQTKLWNGVWATRAVVEKDGVSGRHLRQYIDTIKIDPQRTYTYRVRAIRGLDNSPFSNEAFTTTPAFTGGDDKATCICTGTGSGMVCK